MIKEREGRGERRRGRKEERMWEEGRMGERRVEKEKKEDRGVRRGDYGRERGREK